MNNTGVNCNVCECKHNTECCKCSLPVIEVTHNAAQMQAVETPHFCKSYEKK